MGPDRSLSRPPVDDTNPPKNFVEEISFQDSGVGRDSSTIADCDESLDDPSDAPANKFDSASSELDSKPPRVHSAGAAFGRNPNVHRPATRSYSMQDPIPIKPGGFYNAQSSN